ncbi:MAG: Co2+/Mg2+ efflux protein ApaG [Alphaproteobacteria bacterium]|nr:Co2+/Mg2+ efflux protein ApaG [Alphaproteobacteria bacterium]
MYTRTTRNIKVTVFPSYLPEQSDAYNGTHVWAYFIRLENMGKETVQLINRYWHITDGLGVVQEVRGPGVVGEQPVLEPGDDYQYTSGVPLPTPSGIMRGNYEMETEGGERFLIEIPAFSLDSPEQLKRAN